SSTLTATHARMGTPDFMAPEVALGAAEVDHRADLYAVGVMLHQMLTGEIPRGRFELPSVQRPGVDPRFDPIVDRAMQTNPARRYSSAVEIRSDLEKIGSAPPTSTEASAVRSVSPAVSTAPMADVEVTRPLSESERRETPLPATVATSPGTPSANASPVETPLPSTSRAETAVATPIPAQPSVAPSAAPSSVPEKPSDPTPDEKPAAREIPVEVYSAPPPFAAQYAREKIAADSSAVRGRPSPSRSRPLVLLMAIGAALGLAAFFLPRLPWDKLAAALGRKPQTADATPAAAQPTPVAAAGATPASSQGAPASGFSLGGFPAGGLDPGSSGRQNSNPKGSRASSPGGL
ncbi:MAG TPA: hypothetical protein VK961_17875, partial [Chthoniobacter sp.]|nr:hypothetical protein [Chthoniobacter sp.]